MSWDDFFKKIKNVELHHCYEEHPSRYGTMPDLYFSAILPSSSVEPINANSCFATVGVSDLAGAALFMDEPNIIIIDWNKSVLNIVENRIEEWTEIFASENFDPNRLMHNEKLLENDFSFPYDFEFWERMNMALLELYRKNNDFRTDALQKELEISYLKYVELYKKLEIMERHSKYTVSVFENESMQENSIENKRLLLGEKYFKLNLKIFFRYVDSEILRKISNKKYAYLNLNLFDLDAVDKIVKHMQQAELKLNRINLTDMLDDVIMSQEKLQQFTTTLEKLSHVLIPNANIILNHINDFSLGLSLENTLLRLKQIAAEVALILRDRTSLAIPSLDEYDKTYLSSFKKYSSYYVDKATFYS